MKPFFILILVLFFVGCDNSPETLKIQDKLKTECNQKCEDIHRVGEWTRISGCQCYDKEGQ